MTDFDDDAAGSIASAALAVLREQGPLSLEEWATHLEEYGTATELADVLEYLSEPMLGYLPNGKYVALDTVLEGSCSLTGSAKSKLRRTSLTRAPTWNRSCIRRRRRGDPGGPGGRSSLRTRSCSLPESTSCGTSGRNPRRVRRR